jgi:DNA-binding MarR family transcriptional regulator
MTTRRNSKATARARRASERKASPAHRSFVYKIGILRRLLDRYSGPALTLQSGLTLAEWRVLTNLYSFSPTTSRQLCLRLRTDKAEVSRACAGLIARGYASRRIDTKDRRSALIVITRLGERRHDQIIPLRQALQMELETPLSKAEVGELHRILDKLMQYVAGKIDGAPAPRAAKRRAPRD